jgi:transcriptional regulator with XRE-family HTH domain
MLNFRLRILREKEGITQSDLAKDLGISRVSVSNYELAERVPDADTVVKYAKRFKVSSDYILGLSEFSNTDIEHKELLAVDSFKAFLSTINDYKTGQFAEKTTFTQTLEAKITRANGDIEELGEIANNDSIMISEDYKQQLKAALKAMARTRLNAILVKVAEPWLDEICIFDTVTASDTLGISLIETAKVEKFD